MAAPSKFLQLRTEEHSTRVQDNVGGTLNPLAKALSATPIMGAPPPAWIAPDLRADFVNAGGLNATAGYHKDALGYVHGKGLVTTAAGVAGSTLVYTLAPGYRPAQALLLPAYGTGGTVQFVIINADGTIQNLLLIAAGGDVGLNFSFLAEQ